MNLIVSPFPAEVKFGQVTSFLRAVLASGGKMQVASKRSGTGLFRRAKTLLYLTQAKVCDGEEQRENKQSREEKAVEEAGVRRKSK